MPCSQANDAEIGLFAGLISVDTALGARNKLKAVENWPTGWFFCKLLSTADLRTPPTVAAGHDCQCRRLALEAARGR
jgi:hypothetical protein